MEKPAAVMLESADPPGSLQIRYGAPNVAADPEIDRITCQMM